jgi:hypothetical protein
VLLRGGGCWAPLAPPPRLQALVQLGMGPWRARPTLGGGGDALDAVEIEADEGAIEVDESDGAPSDEVPATDTAETEETSEPSSTDEPGSEVAPPAERGGAGRVGGVTPDEDEPPAAASIAEPEVVEEQPGELDTPADETSDGRSRGLADPVFRLLDHLRGQTQ